MSNDVRQIISALQSKFGDDIPIKIASEIGPSTFYQTWSPMFDYVVGGLGLPAGKIVEIFGTEGSGKTSVCLKFIADLQHRGKAAVFIDAEDSLDTAYAKKLGVNTESLAVIKSANGENVITIVSAMLTLSAPPDIIVIDSVAAITSSIEVEEGMDDQRPALNARMWNKAMRIWNALNKSTMVILINQVRFGIGGPGRNVVVGGGMGIKFHSSIRVEVRMGQWIQDKDNVIGHKIKFRSVKNKAVGHPFRSGEIDWYYDGRSTHNAELAGVAAILGLVEKRGAWFAVGDKKFQGLPALQKELDTNKPFAKKLKERVYSTKPDHEKVDISGVAEEKI